MVCSTLVPRTHARDARRRWQRSQPRPLLAGSAGYRHVPANGHDALRCAVGPQTAAVLIEPCRAGGRLADDAGYLAEARALCDPHDALLVLDEVQTGIGRLGAWFGFQPRRAARTRSACEGSRRRVCRSAHWSPTRSATAQEGSSPAAARARSGRSANAAAALAVLDAIKHEGLVDARTIGAHIARGAPQRQSRGSPRCAAAGCCSRSGWRRRPRQTSRLRCARRECS